MISSPAKFQFFFQVPNLVMQCSLSFCTPALSERSYEFALSARLFILPSVTSISQNVLFSFDKVLVLDLQPKMFSVNQVTEFLILKLFKNYMRYQVDFSQVVKYPFKLQKHLVILNYNSKLSQPIRLQDFLNLTNSKTIWSIKLIFCIQLDSH